MLGRLCILLPGSLLAIGGCAGKDSNHEKKTLFLAYQDAMQAGDLAALREVVSTEATGVMSRAGMDDNDILELIGAMSPPSVTNKEPSPPGEVDLLLEGAGDGFESATG